MKMKLNFEDIKGMGGHAFFIVGLCRDCKHWADSQYDGGLCSEIAKEGGTDDDRIRVYSDSCPVQTEPNFGCNHFMKK